MSRNTVREAVSVLSHANVLEVRQGDGTYVRSNVDPTEIMRRVSRAGILAHFEVRAILEQGAARLAAMRRTEEEVKELACLLEERGDAPAKEDFAIFAERDFAFHFGIVRAAHNEALEELFRYFAASAIANTHALLTELEHAGTRCRQGLARGRPARDRGGAPRPGRGGRAEADELRHDEHRRAAKSIAPHQHCAGPLANYRAKSGSRKMMWEQTNTGRK